MAATAADAPTATEAPVASQQVQQLVRRLGDRDYFVRQQAQEELARLGFDAFEALEDATSDEDFEIASRASYLLRLLRAGWTTPDDSPEVKRCLADYEFSDPRTRTSKIEALAGLPEGQGLAALCRLVRYEQSVVLSKLSALKLLAGPLGVEPIPADVAASARKALDGSKRPGAVWVVEWLRPCPPERWAKLIEAEQELLRRAPGQSSPEIAAGLIRLQIVQLRRLGKTDEAMTAVAQLVELQRGNAETLVQLLEWMIEQKAWKAVDDLASRFSAQFAAEPGLLYGLALAQAEQGQKDRAEQTADKALKLNGGRQPRELFLHVMTAQQLRRRGLFDWARREYEHAVEQAEKAKNHEIHLIAVSALAEMLHDEGQDLDAAKTLEKFVAQLDAGKVAEAKLGGRRASEIRSRMHFFHACHWENQGQPDKQREALERALDADPADADVLIACWRRAPADSDQRRRVVRLIEQAADDTRRQIAEEPENPSPYNQLAWLVGNTEGDLDEALRYSKKSLELRPDEAGFFDTLARVHFARGELDEAVRQQEKAVRLEPHSGLMRRQLELFRKTQQEKP